MGGHMKVTMVKAPAFTPSNESRGLHPHLGIRDATLILARIDAEMVSGARQDLVENGLGGLLSSQQHDEIVARVEEGLPVEELLPDHEVVSTIVAAVAKVLDPGNPEIAIVCQPSATYLATGGMAQSDAPNETFEAIELLLRAAIFEEPFERPGVGS